MLHFMDDTSRIVLQTDACNTGMGAYLFQVKEGKEIPIAFMSKAFEERLSKLCTFQQEGFAIFYALKKWRHLLLDRKFTLMTDHANLMFLKGSSDPKVLRWMVSIQEMDFDVMHIKGTDNKIADAFSRLCGLRHEVSVRERSSETLKRKRTDPIPYVRGERQSERLKLKGNITPTQLKDNEGVKPKTSLVPTNKVDNTHNTMRGSCNPTIPKGTRDIAKIKDAEVRRSEEKEHCVSDLEDEMRTSRRKVPVIVLVEPPSHHLSQVERGSDEYPSRLSEEVAETRDRTVESLDRGPSRLPDLNVPDSPEEKSESDVETAGSGVIKNSIVTSNKNQETPGPGEMIQRPTSRPQLQGKDINWKEKIESWFRLSHNHDLGHTGLDRTISKIFEIREVQRLSIQNRLPKDLTAGIAGLIKSCNTCQKNLATLPTTQASHFSCSVYRKMKRIAIDYIESLRPDAEGNDMIVVIIDCFSRFISLYPVKNKRAEVFLHSYLQWLGMGL